MESETTPHHSAVHPQDLLCRDGRRISAFRSSGVFARVSRAHNVALALRQISGIRVRCITQVAAAGFLTGEVKTRLLLGPIDNEGELHRFPARSRIEARNTDVKASVHFAAV